MTRRAIIIGILAAAALCSVTYFNRSVMRQSAIVGNYIPLSVFGSLIFVVLLNPLAGRLPGVRRFSRGEVAVILTLVLTACGIAESGFMKTFTNVIALPRHYRRTTPAWDDEPTGTFARLPNHMLVADEEEAVTGFVQGARGGPEGVRAVPWGAWVKPLATWLPLVVLLMAAFAGLALVVHRQWAEREKLPYPLAQFASSIIGGGEEGRDSVMRSHAFWIATSAVLVIHLINFAARWWPHDIITIRTGFDLRPLARLSTTLARGRLFGAIFYCRLYFSVIGIAYLVSSDVSFSFVALPVAGTFVQGLLAAHGVNYMGSGEHYATIYTSESMGAFVAFIVMIAFYGRRHYRAVFRRAFGLAGEDEVLPHEVGGARVFLVAAVAVVGLMVAYGLALPFALAYFFMIFVFYVGVSRVVVQTGLFIMKPAWVPHIFLLGLFGGYALGPTAALIAMFFSAVLFAEARETVMPYLVNALSLLTREGEAPRLGRITRWAVTAGGIGLVVGLVVTLSLQYTHGTDMEAGRWFTEVVPKYPFSISTGIAQRIESQGMLVASDALSWWERILAMRPDPTFRNAFLIGAALVIACSIARLRIPGWPINPAVLLLWSWSHCAKLAGSFAVGWAIKTIAMRYGGWRMTRKVRPIMIGLIAGDMLGAFIPAVISATYYFATGRTPPSYSIMP